MSRGVPGKIPTNSKLSAVAETRHIIKFKKTGDINDFYAALRELEPAALSLLVAPYAIPRSREGLLEILAGLSLPADEAKSHGKSIYRDGFFDKETPTKPFPDGLCKIEFLQEALDALNTESPDSKDFHYPDAKAKALKLLAYLADVVREGLKSTQPTYVTHYAAMCITLFECFTAELQALDKYESAMRPDQLTDAVRAEINAKRVFFVEQIQFFLEQAIQNNADKLAQANGAIDFLIARALQQQDKPTQLTGDKDVLAVMYGDSKADVSQRINNLVRNVLLNPGLLLQKSTFSRKPDIATNHAKASSIAETLSRIFKEPSNLAKFTASVLLSELKKQAVMLLAQSGGQYNSNTKECTYTGVKTKGNAPYLPQECEFYMLRCFLWTFDLLNLNDEKTMELWQTNLLQTINGKDKKAGMTVETVMASATKATNFLLLALRSTEIVTGRSVHSQLTNTTFKATYEQHFGKEGFTVTATATDAKATHTHTDTDTKTEPKRKTDARNQFMVVRRNTPVSTRYQARRFTDADFPAVALSAARPAAYAPQAASAAAAAAAPTATSTTDSKLSASEIAAVYDQKAAPILSTTPTTATTVTTETDSKTESKTDDKVEDDQSITKLDDSKNFSEFLMAQGASKKDPIDSNALELFNTAIRLGEHSVLRALTTAMYSTDLSSYEDVSNLLSHIFLTTPSNPPARYSRASEQEIKQGQNNKKIRERISAIQRVVSREMTQWAVREEDLKPPRIARGYSTYEVHKFELNILQKITAAKVLIKFFKNINTEKNNKLFPKKTALRYLNFIADIAWGLRQPEPNQLQNVLDINIFLIQSYRAELQSLEQYESDMVAAGRLTNPLRAQINAQRHFFLEQIKFFVDHTVKHAKKPILAILVEQIIPGQQNVADFNPVVLSAMKMADAKADQKDERLDEKSIAEKVKKDEALRLRRLVTTVLLDEKLCVAATRGQALSAAQTLHNVFTKNDYLFAEDNYLFKQVGKILLIELKGQAEVQLKRNGGTCDAEGHWISSYASKPTSPEFQKFSGLLALHKQLEDLLKVQDFFQKLPERLKDHNKQNQWLIWQADPLTIILTMVNQSVPKNTYPEFGYSGSKGLSQAVKFCLQVIRTVEMLTGRNIEPTQLQHKALQDAYVQQFGRDGFDRHATTTDTIATNAETTDAKTDAKAEHGKKTPAHRDATRLQSTNPFTDEYFPAAKTAVAARPPAFAPSAAAVVAVSASALPTPSAPAASPSADVPPPPAYTASVAPSSDAKAGIYPVLPALLVSSGLTTDNSTNFKKLYTPTPAPAPSAPAAAPVTTTSDAKNSSKKLSRIEELLNELKDLGVDTTQLHLDEKWKKYVCPLSADIMKDPVSMADGVMYEREDAQNYINKHSSNVSINSPVTREPLSHRNLTPNNYFHSDYVDFIKAQIKQANAVVAKSQPQKIQQHATFAHKGPVTAATNAAAPAAPAPAANPPATVPVKKPLVI